MKGGGRMATTHNHAPAPTPEHKLDSKTDKRPSWPSFYGFIAGALLIVMGTVLSGTPLAYVGLVTLTVLILWGLQRLGKWRGIQILLRVPTWDAWKIALVVAAVGLGAWLLGSITGTVFAGLNTGLSSAFGLIWVLITLFVAGLGSIGLLVAVAYRVRWMTIVGIVAFGLVVVFMTQQAVTAGQTPFEQRKEVCEQSPELFPADCD